MRFGVNNLQNHKEWDELYNMLPTAQRNPYFCAEMYEAYSVVEPYPVQCFWSFQDEGNFIFYPFLLRSINSLGYDLDDQYYDIIGAYGYNGPVGLANDMQFLSDYNNELRDHLSAQNVVTELVRYCPIPDNRGLHTYADQIDVLDNVYIDLQAGLDAVWNTSFEPGVRKAIRKGESYGLSTRIIPGDQVSEEDLDVFYQIYIGTMNRNSADTFYKFPQEYFRELTSLLASRMFMGITYHEETPTTTEIVLVDGNLSYGFLGGTDEAYYQYKVNTYQRWDMIKHLYKIGVQSYSLGGSAHRNDGIYKFKMSFARNCINPFYIGTYVHNAKAYAEIILQWELKNSIVNSDDKRLQRYRNL